MATTRHLDGYLLRHHACVEDLFDVFTVSALLTFHDLSPRADLGHNDLLSYMHKVSASFFLLNYFYGFNLFRRPALHVFSALPIPPPRHARGLAMPTRRSPDLRVQNFYLVMCSLLPLDMLGAWPCQPLGC
jgi:hypothetical protein